MSRLFSLLCVLSLAACVTAPPTAPVNLPTATPTAPTPTLPPSRPAITPTPTPPRPLTVWIPSSFSLNGAVNPPLQNALNAAVAATGRLTYTARLKPADGPASLINTLLSAYNVAPDILPDLALLSRTDLARAVSARIVWPLDDRAASLSAYYPFAQNIVSFDGQPMAVPVAAETLLLAYNTRLYASPPTTWGEVLTGPLAVAGDDGLLWLVVHNYVALGGTFNPTSGQPALNSDLLTQALIPLSVLHDANLLYAPTLTANTPQSAAQALRDGRAGLAVMSASDYLGLAVRVNTSAGLLPTPNDQPTALVTGWSWAVVNRGDMLHPQALDVLDALTAPAALAVWTQEARLLPTRPDVLSAWGVSPSAALAANVLAPAQLFPAQARAEVIALALRQAAREVALGNTAPAQAAQIAAQNTLNP